MSTTTKIQWTDRTWNPIRGCAIVSPGCSNCYAMRQAHRFSGAGQPYEGLTRMTSRGPVWTGKIRLVPEALEEPLRWRKPCRVFVNSMSDLFHEDVPDEFIDRVFAAMTLATRHIFQILTKRPERMRDYFADLNERAMAIGASIGDYFDIRGMRAIGEPLINLAHGFDADAEDWDGCPDDQQILPIGNVHLGVSVENQETADERIPILLQTPAAVRFLSVEPLLESVNLKKWLPRKQANWQCMKCGGFVGGGLQTCPHCGADKSYLCGSHVANKPAPGTFTGWINRQPIDWVIVGGESGPNARPCNIEWIREIIAG